MLTSETQALAQSGWVEVSGWDEDEIFFVERAELGWDEFAGKHVALTRMLSEGSIIFVRPIQPTAAQQGARNPEVLQGGQDFVRPEARKTATAVEDRRQRVRAKVNYFACVRSAGFGDDVVACIDMSRGGLGFWTKIAYLISNEVKIAVPYSPEVPGAPAIFVAARIVNIREAPERQMFRCGVMFLPAKGSQAHT